MDDIPMADVSPSELTISQQQQRFNIIDVLGESSHSSMESMSGAITASAAVTAANFEASLSVHSRTYEADESVVLERLQKLYPYVDMKKDALPRYWNSSNRANSAISISPDFLRVHYKGKGSSNTKDAASVRANRSIPPMTIVYYFEVFIASKGVNGYMGVGLSDKQVHLNRLPGWDCVSYGYHGDDGNFFSSSGKGVYYGPQYTTGDVIGCGLNFVTKQIFFTKNGQNLGVATNNVIIGDGLYPTVGMQTAGEMIEVNFGQKKFRYDIEKDIKEAANIVYKSLNAVQLPSEKALWMNRTVTAWLEHEGYSHALAAFNCATNQNVNGGTDNVGKNEERRKRSAVISAAELAMDRRRTIVRLLQEGRAADARREVERHFPTVLHANRELTLLLMIQQYVEMISAIAKENLQTLSAMENGGAASITKSGRSKRTTGVILDLSQSVTSQVTDNGRGALKRRSSEADNAGFPTSSSSSSYPPESGSVSGASRPNGRIAANAAATPQEEGTVQEPMDVSGLGSVVNGNATTTIAGTPPTSTTIIEEVDESGDHIDYNASASAATLPSAENGFTAFGRVTTSGIILSSPEHESGAPIVDRFAHLQKYLPIIEFGHSTARFADQYFLTAGIVGSGSPSLRQRMNDAFSLIGYRNPWQSSNSYLLHQRQRNLVAKAVNCAILGYMGSEKRSRLDDFIRKTRADRKRSLAFSTAVFFADVDRLLFADAGEEPSLLEGKERSSPAKGEFAVEKCDHDGGGTSISRGGDSNVLASSRLFFDAKASTSSAL